MVQHAAFPGTPAMELALAIARRDGAVIAGKSEWRGRVERVSASAILLDLFLDLV